MAQGEKRPVVMEAAKGVPGGVASLGADGKVPQEQLPEFGISNAEIKGNLVDDDAAVITDSQANNKTKRVFWSDIKELLGGLFVPITRKINNKALSSDVSLNAADVGAADRNYMRSAVVGIGATSYTGWFRVGRIRINSAYKTSRTLLSVKGSASKGSGILEIVVRTESSAGVLNKSASKLAWHTLTDSYMKNRFAIIVDGNYADLYVNEGGKYWHYNISILDYMESTTDFTDPSYANIFKLERNYDLSGEYRESITPLLTSSIGFTPEIMGAAAASGFVNGRLFVGGSTGGVTQLGFPSSANSILRQSTSGGPYWTTPANFVKETAVISGTDYTTVRLRGSGLRNADTNPTANGTINWTYE